MCKGVQHDGRMPFWKPASVFAHYVCIIVFAIGEINILLPLSFCSNNPVRFCYMAGCSDEFL